MRWSSSCTTPPGVVLHAATHLPISRPSLCTDGRQAGSPAAGKMRGCHNIASSLSSVGHVEIPYLMPSQPQAKGTGQASSVPGLMRRIVVIVAAGLLLGACGDHDDDDEATPATTAEDADGGGDADAYVEAVVASWNETSELPLDERQTTCVATGLVDVVGVDALTEAGISPDEFAAADDLASLGVELPDDATADLGDALGECDVVETLEGMVIAAFPDEFGVELRPDAATCLTDHLDDRAVVDGWAATFIDGSDERLQRLVSSSMGACPAVATAVLIATAPTEPTPEAEACIGAFVQDNPELVMETLASGESPATATRELGEQMAAACPEAIDG